MAENIYKTDCCSLRKLRKLMHKILEFGRRRNLPNLKQIEIFYKTTLHQVIQRNNCFYCYSTIDTGEIKMEFRIKGKHFNFLKGKK